MDDVTLAMSTQHENNFTGPYAIGVCSILLLLVYVNKLCTSKIR